MIFLPKARHWPQLFVFSVLGAYGLVLACSVGEDPGDLDSGYGGKSGLTDGLGGAGELPSSLKRKVGPPGAELEIQGATLLIPPGALQSAVQISLAKEEAPPSELSAPEGMIQRSEAISVSPYDTVTLGSYELGLLFTHSGASKNYVVAYRSSGDDSTWEPISGATLSNWELRVHPDKFGLYAVFQDSKGLYPTATTETDCGNRVLDQGEACEDGNNWGGDGCSADCKKVELCGDKLQDEGEACDDGGQSATCEKNCKTASCGDGIVNKLAGEACEDGNTLSGDGCSTTCQYEN